MNRRSVKTDLVPGFIVVLRGVEWGNLPSSQGRAGIELEAPPSAVQLNPSVVILLSVFAVASNGVICAPMTVQRHVCLPLVPADHAGIFPVVHVDRFVDNTVI